MFMALMRKLFSREPAAVDRNIQLQEIDVQPEPEMLMDERPVSQPNVIHFADRADLIERGYWSERCPRRVRRVNVMPDVAAEPGGTRRVNRLLRRGYYRSLRHAA